MFVKSYEIYDFLKCKRSLLVKKYVNIYQFFKLKFSLKKFIKSKNKQYFFHFNINKSTKYKNIVLIK